MKKLILFLIGLSFFFTIISPSASAYRLTSDDNPYTTVSLDTSKTLAYFIEGSFGAVSFSHMNEALYQWNKESGYSLMRRDPNKRHYLTDFGTSSSKDTLNLVYKIGVSERYLALNSIRISGYTVVESDINFNIKNKFVNGAVKDGWDTFSVFLHETGHTVGLCDIPNPRDYEKDSVMVGNWESRTNSISWRKLRTDDINGLKVLYP